MKRLWAILCVLLIVSGCTLGGVEVQVNSDGSGKYKLTRIQFESDENGTKQKGLEGAEPRTDVNMSMNIRGYHFEDLNNLSHGNLTFNFQEKRRHFLIDVSVPVNSDAAWFRSLDITRKKIKHMSKTFQNQLQDRIPVPSEGSENGKIPKNLNPKMAEKFRENIPVTIKVKAPGEVKEIKVLQPRQNAPDWSRKGDVNPGASSGLQSENQKNGEKDENTATIAIPLKQIQKSDMEIYKVRIRVEKEINMIKSRNKKQEEPSPEEFHTQKFHQKQKNNTKTEQQKQE